MTMERTTAWAKLAKVVLILCGAVSFSFCALAQNPVPFINSISPVATAPGGAGFTLTVNGAGFASGAVVNWSAGAHTTSLATTSVSATKLTATVPATLIASIPVGASPGDAVPKSCSTDADCAGGGHAVGAHCSALTNTCFRIDYSDRKFGTLDELNLDETAGLQGGADNTDISFRFHAGASLDFGMVPTNGTPVDWNWDGAIGSGVAYNITGNQQSLIPLQGWNDWATSNGMFTGLHFDFQKSSANFNNDNNTGPVSTAKTAPALFQPATQQSSSCAGTAAGGLNMSVDQLLGRFAAGVAARNAPAGRTQLNRSRATPLRKKPKSDELPEPQLWP